MNKKMEFFRMKTVLTALAVLFIFQGCQKEQTETIEQLRPVRYMTITSEAMGRLRTFTGLSQSTQESRLSFKVGGTIIELPIEVGDKLEKGGLVGRLDASQYELQEQQSQAALVQVRAAYRNSESNYERVKGLYENNNASRNDLDAARANSESAQAQVRAAEKQQQIAKLSVEDSTLRAATDCTIASVDVEVNENVAAGSQVALVTCGHELEVIIAVPETLISSVKEGMGTTIRFNAIDENTFAGTVTEVAFSTRGDATFPVTIAIDAAHPDLRAGLAAEVSFSIDRGTEATFILPLASVLNDSRGQFVYLAIPDGESEAVLERRMVELGELTTEGVEILAGIDVGDRVVTAGATVVRDGLRVRL
jgi:multidrug efflux system membrane fusion protein